MSVDVSPDGKTVLFDLLGDLYTVPMKGGRATALTRGSAWDSQPRFAPDGKRIAFVSDRSGSENVWVMDVDGTHARQITQRTDVYPMLHLSWTTEGKDILVRETQRPVNTTDDEQRPQLSRYDTEEGHVQILSDASYVTGGAALPKDAGIVLVTERGVTARTFAGKTQQDTLLVACERRSFQRCDAPRISADGRWLVYTRQSAKASSPPTMLYLRRLRPGSAGGDASQEELLLPQVETGECCNESPRRVVPAYSFTPDSRFLVIAAQGKLKKINLITKREEIIPFEARVRAELAPLTLFPHRLDDGDIRVKQLRSLASSPDGKNWAFTALGKLWRIGADNQARRLTDSDLRESDPAYSPDGKWIAYATWSDTQGGRLWKLPAAGGKPVALSTEPGLYLTPRWLPDASGLVFIYNGNLQSAIKRVTVRNADLSLPIRREEQDEKEREQQRQLDYYPARISAAGGPVTKIGNKRVLSHVEGPVVPRVSVAADGNHIYFLTPEEDASVGVKPVLVSMQIDSGASRDVASFDTYTSPEVVVSPDSRWLAVRTDLNLEVARISEPQTAPVDLSTKSTKGENKALIRLTYAGLAPQWTADGAALEWLWDTHIYRVTTQQLASPAAIQPSLIKTVDIRVPTPGRKDALLLQGARLITMKPQERLGSSCPHPVDGSVVERGDVLIQGRRIAAIGLSGSVKVPAGTRVLDVSGMTIIPGLTDVLANTTGIRHFHLPPQHNSIYDANLAYGVTTVYTSNTASSETSVPFEMLETGDLRGPRGVLGFIEPQGPGGFDRTTPQTIERSLRSFKELGHQFYKNYEAFHTRYQRQLLNEAAARQGLSISFHQHDIYQLLQNVTDGYGMIIHPTDVTPLYRDVMELLVRSGTAYNEASFSSDMRVQDMKDLRHRNFWSDDEFNKALWMAKDSEARLASAADAIPRERQKLRDISHLICAGAIVSTGTDAFKLSGFSVHSNLWSAAQEGGLTPAEALQVGTLNGIRALGMERDLGSIEAGKIADLAILDKNPLDDIRNTVATHYVVRDGIVYDADTLDVVN